MARDHVLQALEKQATSPLRHRSVNDQGQCIDGFAVYQSVLESGTDPATIVMGGDSAGGGLALAVLQRARDANLPLPCAVVLLSPWCDLSRTRGGTIDANHEFDYLSGPMLADAAGHYLAGADARQPEVSAVFANLKGLPPMLVHSGTAEILLDQNIALVARAKDDGVEVVHEIAEGMIHVFQIFAPTEAAGHAIRSIGAYIQTAVSGADISNPGG